MPIVDAQARAIIPIFLRRMAETVEDQRIQIPFERSEGLVAMLQVDRPLIEEGTGQKFYSLVYVMVAETKEAIDRRVETLLPPGAA